MLKATHPPNETKVLTGSTPKTFLKRASKEFEALTVSTGLLLPASCDSLRIIAWSLLSRAPARGIRGA